MTERVGARVTRFPFPYGYFFFPAVAVMLGLALVAAVHWAVGVAVVAVGLWLFGGKQRAYGGAWFARSYSDGELVIRSVLGRRASVDLPTVRAAGSTGPPMDATLNPLDRRTRMETLVLVGVDAGRVIRAKTAARWGDAGVPDRPWLHDGSERSVVVVMSPTKSDDILRVLAPDLLRHAETTDWFRARLTRLIGPPPA